MTPEDVLHRLDAPLSLRKRVGYVTLGLAGLAGGGLIGLLWATEPGLPPRTHVAFGAMTAIGLGWALFGGWAVTRRTPLFARDRVVAGWLGLVAWLLSAAGALAIMVTRDRLEPWLIGVVLALGAVALVNLRAARRARAALLLRRKQLGG
jgi:hypothetical protein